MLHDKAKRRKSKNSEKRNQVEINQVNQVEINEVNQADGYLIFNSQLTMIHSYIRAKSKIKRNKK